MRKPQVIWGPVPPGVSASQQTCKGGREKMLERSPDKGS